MARQIGALGHDVRAEVKPHCAPSHGTGLDAMLSSGTAARSCLVRCATCNASTSIAGLPAIELELS
jgi:hypothetical protein